MTTNLIQTQYAPSFRGIAFALPAEEPLDVGAEQSIFSVTALIGGQNHAAVAAAFEAALSQKGPGALLHPRYGEVQAVVREARRAQAPGGFIYTVVFERVDALTQPVAPDISAAQQIVSGAAKLLNRAAVKCLDKSEAPDLLSELLKTPGFYMAENHTLAAAMAETPAGGSGAVNPNPLRR